jgi:hypothetical protein
MGNMGNAAVLQIVKEATYGTLPAAMTRQLRFSSEGFKYLPTNKDEGLLTGGKLSGRVVTLGKKVEGSFSTLARPDDIGLLLLAAFGVEDQTPNKVSGSTAVYEHVFTLLGTETDDELPSLSAVIDRVESIFSYVGLKVNTLSFSAAPDDYLKIDVNVVGRDEGIGTLTTGLSYSALIPFKFSNATVVVDGKTLEGTSVKFELNNNLDSGSKTTLTGLYYMEPSPGAREVKCDIEVLYDADTDGIREDFLLTDDEAAISINFESDQEAETGYNYALNFSIPAAQLTDASPTVSSADRIKMSLSFKAVDHATDEIECTLTNLLATAY